MTLRPLTVTRTESFAFFCLGLGFLLLAIFLPELAHAQTVLGNPAPAPVSLLEQLKGYATAPNLTALLTAIGGLGGTAAWLTARRKKLLAYAVHHGFMIAEDAGRENEGDDNFDKAAVALKAIDTWMLANGWRAMTPTESAIAALQLQAKHGEEVAKAKVAEAGAVVS